MLNCGHDAELWTRCWIVGTMLNWGHDAELWSQCWIVDRMLNCGQDAELWARCWIVDRMLNCGQDAELWARCWIVDTMLKCGYDAEFWTQCWIVDRMLNCGHNAELLCVIFYRFMLSVCLLPRTGIAQTVWRLAKGYTVGASIPGGGLGFPPAQCVMCQILTWSRKKSCDLKENPSG